MIDGWTQMLNGIDDRRRDLRFRIRIGEDVPPSPFTFPAVAYDEMDVVMSEELERMAEICGADTR